MDQINRIDGQEVDKSTALSVAIVGGGLGGLSAAIALQRAGIECTVYERDDSFKQRKEGFGLTLTNNPKGALASLGLLESCIDADCPSTCHWVFGPTGTVLGYYGRYFKDNYDDARDNFLTCPSSDALKIRDRGNLRVPRQDLREMLLRQLQPGTVRWGHRLVDVIDDPLEESVILQFEGIAANARAHVVVGADGIHSQVRRLRDSAMATNGDSGCQTVQASTLSYLGVAVIIGISPVTSSLLHHQGFYVLDGIHRLFTMPFRSGICDNSSDTPELTMWQLSFSGLSEEEANALRMRSPEELVSEALRRTNSWFSTVQDMVRKSLHSDVWATALYDRPSPVLHSRGKESLCRLTVLGDACHPMSMFKGQGANQALQDGVHLAKWLAGEIGLTCDLKPRKKRKLTPASPTISKIATRLRCFEREMVDRAAPKVAASRTAAAAYHSPEALTSEYGVEGLVAPLTAFTGVSVLDDAADTSPMLEHRVWKAYCHWKAKSTSS